MTAAQDLDALWALHNAAWRDTAQIASHWHDAASVDPRLLAHRVRGDWWRVIDDAGVTLLVTREYEHLVMALSVVAGKPRISFMPLPHPSGLVADRARGVVHVASTRNPNQVFDFAPATGVLARGDMACRCPADRPLVPVQARFLPGCLYMHDLALIGGELHANAVGHNAVVSIGDCGAFRRAWWPRCIDAARGPRCDRNYLQLNSIAAGSDLRHSFFSASCAAPSTRRPGHRNFPVDKRGVVFSGATREPVAFGLTRPHSARLRGSRIWVANSGYGELGFVDNEALVPVARLQGWTRGLCLHKAIAFCGTSRVIPRFRQYAPGLDCDKSMCGIHAVDIASGRVLGSIAWPYGNQIFAIDWMPRSATQGFPFSAGRRRAHDDERRLFYSFIFTTKEHTHP
jgi:uncharacterized protein (TIGR03032 family)